MQVAQQDQAIAQLESACQQQAVKLSTVVPHTYNAYPPCPVPVVVANTFKAANGSFALILANHGLSDVSYNARVQLDEDYDNNRPGHQQPLRKATVSLTIKAMSVLAVPLKPDGAV